MAVTYLSIFKRCVVFLLATPYDFFKAETMGENTKQYYTPKSLISCFNDPTAFFSIPKTLLISHKAGKLKRMKKSKSPKHISYSKK